MESTQPQCYALGKNNFRGAFELKSSMVISVSGLKFSKEGMGSINHPIIMKYYNSK